MIEAAVQHVLSTNVTVMAAVSSRIAHGSRQQGDEVPAVYHVGADERQLTLSGARLSTYQVSSLGADGAAAADLADKVADALTSRATYSNIGTTGVQFHSVTRLARTHEPQVEFEDERTSDIVTEEFQIVWKGS